MEIRDAIRRRVDELLKNKKMTRYELCKKVAMHESTVRNLYREGTTNKSVSMNTAFLLAEGFDMTILEFLDSPLFSFENIETN
ncbi:MAG: helix-turn-helix transcriptional regulator [Christensenellaceae bacterium]|nr:helix-turn-helix transcriptional regulator [Christensenellaceae bacterium]